MQENKLMMLIADVDADERRGGWLAPGRQAFLFWNAGTSCKYIYSPNPLTRIDWANARSSNRFSSWPQRRGTVAEVTQIVAPSRLKYGVFRWRSQTKTVIFVDLLRYPLIFRILGLLKLLIYCTNLTLPPTAPWRIRKKSERNKV